MWWTQQGSRPLRMKALFPGAFTLTLTQERNKLVFFSHWYLGFSFSEMKLILTYKSYFNSYLPELLGSIKMLPSSKITESSFKLTFKVIFKLLVKLFVHFLVSQFLYSWLLNSFDVHSYIHIYIGFIPTTFMYIITFMGILVSYCL